MRTIACHAQAHLVQSAWILEDPLSRLLSVMSVYVFETIDVIGAGRGALVDRLLHKEGPYLEESFGVRLLSVWATAGSTANWPEANALWEMDDWEQFGLAQQARFPLEEKDAYGCELVRHAHPLRSGGQNELLVGSDFSPPGERIREAVQNAMVVLRESVRTRPGALATYQKALQEEYLPVASERGLTLLGAYHHALRPNTATTLWGFRDWSHVAEVMETAEADDAQESWVQRQAALLEDTEGWLLAAPPAQPLGT